MIPDPRFLKQKKDFWAHVRTISEEVGYTRRGKKEIKVPTPSDMMVALNSLGLRAEHVYDTQKTTAFGQLLHDYFVYRADVLNNYVEPRLMTADRARKLFEEACARYKPAKCDIPWNKQKGEKKAPAYLTALVSMIVRANAPGMPCNFDPKSLTTFTRDGKPLRTLARRVDGAFPRVVNPIAIWEVKEYYYTTTFGSRVADGVYESLLDGMELEELAEHEKVPTKHYLMVDAYHTWWTKGKSYLCRIIDTMHMGYVDEVLFGYEVVERLPDIVKEWVALAKQREAAATKASAPPRVTAKV